MKRCFQLCLTKEGFFHLGPLTSTFILLKYDPEDLNK